MSLDKTQAARLRRAARGNVNKHRRKKARPWRPHGSCAWFCDASAWLRLVRELWELPDPFEVAAIARKVEPVRRRVHPPEEPVFKGCDEAEAKVILEPAQASWATWRRSVSLGGFWHTPQPL